MKIKFYKSDFSEIGIFKAGSRIYLVFGLFEVCFMSRLIREAFANGELIYSKYYGFSKYIKGAK